MIMSEMKEKETNTVPEEITDAELEEVVGGVQVEDNKTWISIVWNVDEKMNDIWNEVDKYRPLFHIWSVKVDILKERIRVLSEEKLSKRDFRYHAAKAGRVVIKDTGSIE